MATARGGQRRHHVVDRQADCTERRGIERVGGVLLPEADRPGEQGERLGLEGALLAGRADEQLQLLEGADRGELLLRLDAEPADRPVGGPVQEADQRAEHPGDHDHRRRQGVGRGPRPGDGDRLGDQLAHHHRDEGGQHEAERRSRCPRPGPRPRSARPAAPAPRAMVGSAMKPITSEVTVMPELGPGQVEGQAPQGRGRRPGAPAPGRRVDARPGRDPRRRARTRPRRRTRWRGSAGVRRARPSAVSMAGRPVGGGPGPVQSTGRR